MVEEKAPLDRFTGREPALLFKRRLFIYDLVERWIPVCSLSAFSQITFSELQLIP
ncbi:MAG: hypothetical protein G8D61_14375 [gamma proteobacterium symbiont of Ctena orbiculata]|nr:hypothetical protein [Candidatus Thiodiazotropha taylori]MBT3059834.1 hypothetical protein [Candidatus Thiodiazotropha sp. (ex Lucina pensylvanica)]MBT3061331.1 hypothetical protein [Candidatus Thiodiazotropha sp. (ex Lucina pensylvanica)]MBV2094521.1 hypothetical protein [Candidatus Thiodiazotropha sp. (ex Codakia orbicularis)]